MPYSFYFCYVSYTVVVKSTIRQCERKFSSQNANSVSPLSSNIQMELICHTLGKKAS